MSGEGQQQQQQQQDAAPDISALIGGLSQDNRTVMERKGWLKDGKPVEGFNFDKVVDSYRGLESLQGKKTLEEPNVADPEAFAKWPGHALLGVPDKPEAYDFGERPQLPEGMKWSERDGDGGIPWDTAGENMLRVAMHKGHIGKSQAQAIMKEIVQQRVGQIVQGANAQRLEAQTVKANLQGSFGVALDGALQTGNMAVSKIAELAGLKPEASARVVDQLAAMAGNEEATRFIIQLGKMMGEDTLKGGKAAGFATSPDAAKASIADFEADAGKMAALFNPDDLRHKSVNEEWQRLNKIVYPKKG